MILSILPLAPSTLEGEQNASKPNNQSINRKTNIITNL